MVTNWYYAKNNERHGPVSLAHVRRLLASGSLEPTDLVWAEHLPGWVAAKDVREITARDFLGSIPGLRQPAASADLDAFPGPGRTIVINQPPVQRWSPGLAAVLSFFVPGLGQLYKGQIVNGIVWFFVVGMGYVALILPGLLLHFFCVIGAASGNPWTEGKTTVVRE